MISERRAKDFCKDPIEKIENYEAAIADTSQIWDCHHRLELTLDGEFAHSREDLIRMGMYYKRPYFELIFLTPTEHLRIHNAGKNHPMYGKTHSNESKKKISATLSGRTHSDETKKKISKNNVSHQLAQEFKEYKKNGGTLKCRDWKHKRKQKLQEQWKKYRNDGGTLDYYKWYKLNHTPT